MTDPNIYLVDYKAPRLIALQKLIEDDDKGQHMRNHRHIFYFLQLYLHGWLHLFIPSDKKGILLGGRKET